MPQHIKIRKDIFERILTSLTKDIIECSPKTCPLCYKSSPCDGSNNFCVAYHMGDIHRIEKNIDNQK